MYLCFLQKKTYSIFLLFLANFCNTVHCEKFNTSILFISKTASDKQKIQTDLDSGKLIYFQKLTKLLSNKYTLLKTKKIKNNYIYVSKKVLQKCLI